MTTIEMGWLAMFMISLHGVVNRGDNLVVLMTNIKGAQH